MKLSAQAGLSIVIPVHNEIESISRTLVETIGHVPDNIYVELIVVDDGSTDGTSSLVTDHSLPPNVDIQLVTHSTQRGLGAALLSGFNRSTQSTLTWIPGDGEYRFAELVPALDLIELNNIVLARRNSRSGLRRGAISLLMHRLIHVLFQDDLREFSGIFIIARENWHTLNICSESGFFNLEVALTANRMGLRRQWVTLNWYPRMSGKSSVFRPKVLVLSFLELISLKFRRPPCAK